MSDTAALRRRGVPTSTLCWEDFERVATMHGRVLGIDSAPLCVYPGRRTHEHEEDDLQHVGRVAAVLAEHLSEWFEVVG